MYVDAFSPNYPFKGPFELEASLGSLEASSIIFWYSMYGQTMGSLALQTYSTNLGWVEHWSKSGDQGEDWQMAAVAIDSEDSSIVKFVVYTGWDYSSDVAIDDVNITLRSTPAPSVTASPSNTPSPTLTPSPAPTHAPTTILTSTSAQLQSALEESVAIQFRWALTSHCQVRLLYRTLQQLVSTGTLMKSMAEMRCAASLYLTQIFQFLI